MEYTAILERFEAYLNPPSFEAGTLTAGPVFVSPGRFRLIPAITGKLRLLSTRCVLGDMLRAFQTRMALNPFEQLRLFVPEPRQAFEDLVAMLLADSGRIDGGIKIFCGDGGIDGYQGEFSKGGSLTVYQSKYFTEPWGDSQKQQIRESFKRVADSREFNLQRWFLCIPVRPTLKDVRWFDEWRSKQSIPIELVDGDELTQLLEGSAGARTRQRFTDWGVFSVRGGSPVTNPKLKATLLPLKRLAHFLPVLSVQRPFLVRAGWTQGARPFPL